MKFKFIATILTTIVFLFSLTQYSVARPLANRGATSIKIDKTVKRIMLLVNDARLENGLEELIWNPEIAGFAQSYAETMAQDGFFSHYDKSGDSVAERAKKAKLKGWSLIGENLFMSRGYKLSGDLTFKAWMESSGHRANILNWSFNQTGIGIAADKKGKIFVAQVFATID